MRKARTSSPRSSSPPSPTSTPISSAGWRWAPCRWPPAVAAVSHGGKKPVNAFFVRKQAKDHGTKSLIEGLPNGETLRGKRVVVVEDVTTTGGSAIKAAEALRAEGAEVVGVVTVSTARKAPAKPSPPPA